MSPIVCVIVPVKDPPAELLEDPAEVILYFHMSLVLKTGLGASPRTGGRSIIIPTETNSRRKASFLMVINRNTRPVGRYRSVLTFQSLSCGLGQLLLKSAQYHVRINER